jgi:hypothetical protein
MAAILGLLIQAGFTVWHATAMSAGPVNGAETAMICHPEAAVTSTADQSSDQQEGESPLSPHQTCPCCLGLTLAAALLEAPAIPKLVYLAGKSRTEAKAAERLGRHPLSPEGRGPPKTA